MLSLIQLLKFDPSGGACSLGSMLQALLRTITELLDSKKAAYSFIASVAASVLHLYFGVDVQNALLLVSPLGVATLSQAHVDAAAAKNGKHATTTALGVATASDDAVEIDAAKTDAAKTDG